MSGKALLRTLAVTGLLLVTACSAADRPAEDTGGPLRTELTDGERRLLGTAEERLIADCMRDQGFQYRLDPGGPRTQAPERSFGLDDVAWARRHGYGLAEAARVADGAVEGGGGKAAAEKGTQAR
ncbi:hypothetical protein [Streptomyces sp. NPDC003635]